MHRQTQKIEKFKYSYTHNKSTSWSNTIKDENAYSMDNKINATTNTTNTS